MYVSFVITVDVYNDHIQGKLTYNYSLHTHIRATLLDADEVLGKMNKMLEMCSHNYRSIDFDIIVGDFKSNLERYERGYVFFIDMDCKFLMSEKTHKNWHGNKWLSARLIDIPIVINELSNFVNNKYIQLKIIRWNSNSKLNERGRV